ncbi:general secretion pathway protein A [Geothermobacter ehrlichii]|uniref:General secretion pathway protein A n=1 Tax=Geothermobacter ehrlichii TaxID=213224 RepID=A0A5D3WM88_9BACT|nr:AAA family ATPase [Geothermobacter ehrlichii]TYP00286.1 general secretion pathway protein A [Geothermobacter ehrlichii]
MYLQHFGFERKPFNITPNPDFIFLSGTHKEAFAHLLYGIQNHCGFIEITGEVGTGKTTVLRTLLNQLADDRYRLALIFNPSLSAIELMRNIVREFGIAGAGDSLDDLQQGLNRFLLEENRVGRTVVLIIDEAQNLAPEVLEQIRLLSNLETETDKLIQIVLVGQPELASMLDREELRQLRQRITVRYRLEPMVPEDVVRYIEHRIAVAGGRARGLFDKGALKCIVERTGGNPRLINVLCDRALLAAYADDAGIVERRHVRQVLVELGREGAERGLGRRRRLWWSVGFVLVLGGFLLALALLSDTLNRFGDTEDPQAGRWSLSQGGALPEKGPSGATAVAAARQTPAVGELYARVDGIRRQLATVSSGRSPAPGIVRLASLWGVALETGDETPLPELMAACRRRGLTLTRFDGSLDDLLKFDLPVLLELTLPGEAEPRYLVLLSRRGDSFRVFPEQVGQGRLTKDELAGLWSGRAYLLWKNHEEIPFVGSRGQRGAAVTRLQRLLARGGYARGLSSGVYDEPTIEAVTRFQAEAGLVQDGRVGPQSLILLYRRCGYPEARLGETPEKGQDAS